MLQLIVILDYLNETALFQLVPLYDLLQILRLPHLAVLISLSLANIIDAVQLQTTPRG